eukprot:7389544-Lingulodinium_polyedra.AAC.1
MLHYNGALLQESTRDLGTINWLPDTVTPTTRAARTADGRWPRIATNSATPRVLDTTRPR